MPTVTNFLVSSLPDYVQTNREILVKSFGLVGTATRSRIGLQTGIKKDAYLNYLDLSAVFQDGSNCAFNPLDEITLTQREINTAAIKVDAERAQAWIKTGAQPTETVKALLKKANAI